MYFRTRLFLIATLVSFGVFISSCFLTITGTGPVVTKSIHVEPYDGLEVDIPANITLVAGDSMAVAITAQQNIIDNIQFEFSSNKLTIKSDKNYRSTKPVEIVLSVPNLKEIELNGSGNIHSLNPVKGDDLRLKVNGSGEMTITVNTNEINSEINGSGDLTLSGKTSSHKAEINGSGNIHAQALNCDKCKISINGSGDAQLNVATNLDAEISGSGNIEYSGSPSVNSHVTGSGEVSRKK